MKANPHRTKITPGPPISTLEGIASSWAKGDWLVIGRRAYHPDWYIHFRLRTLIGHLAEGHVYQALELETRAPYRTSDYKEEDVALMGRYLYTDMDPDQAARQR